MAKREKIIKVEILQVLKDCGTYMLPEESLAQQVMLGVRPSPLLSEVMVQVKALEAANQILGVREDDEVKWKITAGGMAKLYELRMG